MKSFHEWIEDRENRLDETAMTYGSGNKPSQANKEEVIQYWRGLVPTQAVSMQPVPADHKGSTYSQDGIRITGSRPFIDGILGRIKDLISQDNAETTLEVSYREIDSAKQVNDRPDTYVFYCMAKQRAPKPIKMKPGQTQKQDRLEINKVPQIKPATPPTLPSL